MTCNDKHALYTNLNAKGKDGDNDFKNEG